jgi:hypothetical protein
MPAPRRRRKDLESSNHVVGTFGTTAIGDMPNPVKNLESEPSHDEIARRAYQLYQARGCEHGRDWDDWLQAERELRQGADDDVIDRILATEGPYAAA